MSNQLLFSCALLSIISLFTIWNRVAYLHHFYLLVGSISFLGSRGCHSVLMLQRRKVFFLMKCEQNSVVSPSQYLTEAFCCVKGWKKRPFLFGMSCLQIKVRITKLIYIYIYIYLPYKRKEKKKGTVATLTARLTAAMPQRCGRACTRHLQKAVCLNAWNAHLPFGFTYLLLHKWRTVPWY